MSKRLVPVMIALGFILPGKIWAQSQVTSGVATVIEMTEANTTTGDVVCVKPGGFVKCNEKADPSIFGVVNLNPAAMIDNRAIQNGVPVETTGIVLVKVSTREGAIDKGDYVTSSDIPGVAVVAKDNGYVIGSAQMSYENADANAVGQIPVALNIHLEAGLSSARSNLIAVLTRSTEAPVFAPLDSLRYLLAAAMILLSFVLGFVYFGRTASKGVEAVGRNPLARKQIQMNVALHLIVTFVVVLIGLFVSYLILIL